MRKLTKLTIILVFGAFMASAQINTPQPSPAGSVSATVGLTDVTIDYFRPGVKGRQIFGDGDKVLLPFGQLWRTGANSGTQITFSTDVTMGDGTVEAGTYLILSVPGQDQWEFILYADPSIGGNIGAVEEDKKVAVFKVSSTKLASPVERLTFNISDISEDNTKANIHMAWADRSVKVPFEVSYDEIVMAQIEKNTQVNPANYVQAATYYFTTGKDLNKALQWMDKYLAMGENNKQFWHQHTRANILAKMGKKEEAVAAAQKSLEMAQANEAGDFGYVQRNKDLIASLQGK